MEQVGAGVGGDRQNLLNVTNVVCQWSLKNSFGRAKAHIGYASLEQVRGSIYGAGAEW